MFRSLRKAAQSLERGLDSAFSNAPPSHTAFKNVTLEFAAISVRLGPVFAEGGYSFIHVATPLSPHVPSNTRYAVKRLSCADAESSRQAHCEIDLLRKLPPHPNVVKFYDAIFQQAHAFLLFELLDGGTLPEMLSRSNPSAHKKLLILAHVSSAIVHLHSQQPPLFIRDVKLENVLYDRLQRCYKLCDFGSATAHTCRPLSRADILAVEEQIANNCTAMYRAPELVDLYSGKLICERADVWSLGCIWYALLFGSLPFDGSSALQITNGLVDIPTEPSYPDEFILLLKKMLVVDPAHRYDSFQVLQHADRILGRQTNPQVLRTGNELRTKRRHDFGIAADSRCADDAVDLPSAVAPVSEASAAITPADPTPRSLIGHFDELLSGSERSRAPTAHPVSEPMRTTGDQSNSGWADFDSAFGESTNCASKVASRVSSNPLLLDFAMPASTEPIRGARSHAGPFLPQSDALGAGKAFGGVGGRTPGSDRSSASSVSVAVRKSQGQACLVPSLIDLSDTTSSFGAAGSEERSGRGEGTHEQQQQRESGKAAKFDDLIDFG